MAQIDFRLVQTAVMGGRDSDQPVILPEEAHNLDEFRRQFGKDDFWCGTLLGGCGERLMTKSYETKVCHFSHLPDRDGSRAACHRTANGVDSADHLFIKAHVTRWLAGQGHAAQAELCSLGHGPGDAVDFVLRATNQRLRFELRPNDYRSWRGTADSLAAKEGHVEWVFGLESAITRDMTARYGYALRVRCEIDGNSRRVLIGTVTENRPVAWSPLEQCRMTGDGLITPDLDELRGRGLIREGAARHDAVASSLPLRGAEIVFAIDGEARPDTDSPLVEGGRYLRSGFIKPAGHRILKAQLSLPHDTPRPTEQYVYQLAGAVRLLVTEADRPGESTLWAVRADSLIQLKGLDAERTGLWRPPVALDEPLPAPKPATRPAPAPTVPVQSQGSRTATVLRRALEDVARDGATTTWKQLAERVGLDLAHLPDPKRRDLLVEVDKPRARNRSLLCVLVRAPSGRPLSYIATVLRLLQVPAPASESALYRWSEEQIRAAHTAYGHRTPPVLASAAVAEAPRPAEARAAQKQLTLLKAQLAVGRATFPRATGRRAARLATTVKDGEQHQRLYESVRQRRQELRAWQRESERLLDDLDRLIGHPLPAPAPAKKATPAVPPAAKSPVSPGQDQHSFQAQTAADIARLTQLFKQARDADDLNEARRIRQEVSRVATDRLFGEPRQNLLLLRTDLQTWINSREAAAANAALHTLFADLATASPAPTPLALRSALAHSKVLKRRCPGPLPQDLHTALARLEAQVNGESVTPDDGATLPATHPSPSGAPPSESAALAEARAEFAWLVKEIRGAQEVGDLASVETARHLAGPIYGRRLSPEDRATYTPLMREVKAWCQEQDPNTDPILRRIRQVLAELGRAGNSLATEQLAAFLDKIGSLRRELDRRLPVLEEVQVKRWKRQLKARTSSAPRRAAPLAADPVKAVPSPKATAPSPPDRLPIETIDKLAAIARDVLKDAARSGGSLLTWGDLRLRMAGGLPHLHPDDQGELLIAVDRETPVGEPLLSTLVASADASLHWLYRHVCFSLGRERIPEPDLPAHWATEVLRLRQTWRHR
ncbi:hypothetical protein EOT10_03985 [Streptomyces antnestii]|uniref:Uncharacterized protein n=1 Tax=Streptomyces antnestii TaxID=2494256 RepID=A0A3S2W1G8_9ACTN|nr:hypothetical protein [Streptomyces sp. San01]RVU29006.1 hypothetical protein EOT10_03985 [Streptomyces sp. San01]